MKNKDVNLLQLEIVASALGSLLLEVTFVGGSTTVFLVDDAAHFGVRQTEDVDVIVDVATLVEHQQFSKKLRELGFSEDPNAPICRWLFDSDSDSDSDIGKVKLDVMPIDEKILGFSNRWYKAAIDNAMEMTLPSNQKLNVVSPVYFIATKFEAFAGRGGGNFYSHDLEDIIFVMENRKNLSDDLLICTDELKAYFSQHAKSLLNDEFLNILPGLLNNAESTGLVEKLLIGMSAWKK